MIRVTCQPEPDNFERDVRQQGYRFLAQTPSPTRRQWESHSYWRKVLRQMHNQYGGICAYSCHWISYDTGADTVEHFLPKKVHPHLAYEWSNYRFVCAKLNGRKGIHSDVLDPFEIETGWFVLDFPSLLVKPAATLPTKLSEQVCQTIDRLELNDEGTCMKSRAKYVEDYCKREISFQYLSQNAPFIALELKRLGLVEEIRAIMIY